MSDEKEIRELFGNWIESTIKGDLELAHQCIADDALFFVPGRRDGQKDICCGCCRRIT